MKYTGLFAAAVLFAAIGTPAAQAQTVSVGPDENIAASTNDSVEWRMGKKDGWFTFRGQKHTTIISFDKGKFGGISVRRITEPADQSKE